MKTVGIVCEYDPFHGGHAYQLRRVREDGADVIVSLMSGHATQRGEVAAFDKYTRAAMALSCGADVVLELPYPYCAASAAYFAGAGVAILDELGVDELCFGSECGDRGVLERAAEAAEDPQTVETMKVLQRQGAGSTGAFFEALGRWNDGEAVSSLSPNDILGVSYLRAIRQIDSTMTCSVLKRDGSAFGEKELSLGEFPSATALRRYIRKGFVESLEPFIPGEGAKILMAAIQNGLGPSDMSALSALILGFLRLTPPERLAECAEMTGGLQNRLCQCAVEQTDLEGFYRALSSKTYTNARVRRAVLFALTGVTVRELTAPPTYLLLLGANDTGRRWLRQIRGKSSLPVVAKAADAPGLGRGAERQFTLGQQVDRLFSLALPRPVAPERWTKTAPVIVSLPSP